MYKYHINYLILALFCGTFFSFAQEKEKFVKQHAISYYLGFGPRIEHFIINENQSSIVNPTDGDTEHFFNFGGNFYHELRYKQKFGVRLGIHTSNTRLNNYMYNLYSSSDVAVLNKNLNENVSNSSRIFSMYYIQKFNPYWSLHYEINTVDQYSELSDNVIVHYNKEGDLIAPLIEYNAYEIQREFVGFGLNFVYQSEEPLSLSLGVHLNTLVSQKVIKDINYFDDYYLLKDVYGVDIHKESDPDDIQKLHLALSVSVKWKLFGFFRAN